MSNVFPFGAHNLSWWNNSCYLFAYTFFFGSTPWALNIISKASTVEVNIQTLVYNLFWDSI